MKGTRLQLPTRTALVRDPGLPERQLILRTDPRQPLTADLERCEP